MLIVVIIDYARDGICKRSSQNAFDVRNDEIPDKYSNFDKSFSALSFWKMYKPTNVIKVSGNGCIFTMLRSYSTPPLPTFWRRVNCFWFRRPKFYTEYRMNFLNFSKVKLKNILSIISRGQRYTWNETLFITCLYIFRIVST